MSFFSGIEAPQYQERFRWGVRIRWAVILSFLILALVSRYLGLFPTVRACYIAAALGAVMNIANDISVRTWRYVRLTVAGAVFSDTILITYVVHHTGGIHSPFLFMYFVQVLTVAMLINLPSAAVTAVLGFSLFTAVYYGNAAGLLAPASGVAGESPLLFRGVWLGFIGVCLAFLTVLGGTISDHLRASRESVQQKNQELQRAISAWEEAHAELRIAHQQLKETESQLIHSEKMRALGQLVAGVAHELNNALSLIYGNMEHVRGYLQRLQRMVLAYGEVPLMAADAQRIAALRTEANLDFVLEDLPELIANCEEGARRSKEIVADLRAFSRADEREAFRRVDLHDGIHRTLNLLRSRLRDRIVVRGQYGELPEVECIPGQLNQVWMNLLTNAVDAIGDTGEICLITSWRSRVRDHESGTGWVEVEIRDNGCGIAEEHIGKIFDPFFTTKKGSEGTGLGLSIAYNIVRHHRGEISVESQPGQGTNVRIILPVEQPQAQAAE